MGSGWSGYFVYDLLELFVRMDQNCLRSLWPINNGFIPITYFFGSDAGFHHSFKKASENTSR
jgi:hypothetical protein